MTAFRWTLVALLAHWRRRPLQLAALIGGLALATALWSGVQAINTQARDSYARAAEMLGGAETITIARADGGSFDQSAFIALRRAGLPVSPVLDGAARVGERRLRILGVEPVTAPAGALMAAFGAGDGDDDDGANAILDWPRRALVAPETLDALGLSDGEAPANGDAVLPPLQARAGVAPATALMDIGEAQRVLEAPGRISRLVAPADAADGEAARAALAAQGLAVVEGPEEGLDGLTDSFHLNLTAFGLLSFAVGLFIAYAMVGLAFEQRAASIRTVRACGASGLALGAALLAEAAAFGVVAGGIGVVGGWLLAAALLPDVAATLRGLYGAPVEGGLALAGGWWLSGLGMSLLGALGAAGGAAWRAATLPVLTPAQPNAWRDAHRRRSRRQVFGGVALLMLAAMIGRSGASIEAGFALLAALLVGAALLAPALLDLALCWGARRARSALGVWAWADARLALPGLSLALSALLLALAANIGVGAMVGSFRATFEDWLDRRLAAEIYIRAPDENAAAALASLAATDDRIRALLPSRDVELRVGGWPVDLEGLADHATYRDNWPLLSEAPDVWDALARGEAALVSEQLARKLKLRVGRSVDLPAERGPWTVRVVGIYPDYGNPKGQIVVNHAAHARFFPNARRGSYGVRADPAETRALMAALAEDPALAGAEMIDQAAIKRLSLEIFDRTFTVTTALNALTLMVAGAALFTSLTTIGAMRLPQLAPVWAAGATRATIGRIEFIRAIGLSLGVAALAIPLGVALAWALVAVVNVQAFGWRLPLQHYPSDWARLTALAALTAAAAAALPAWRLSRTPPAKLLGVFASER